MLMIIIMTVAVDGSHHGYLAGGIIALLLLGYLIYALIKPEKF